MQKLAERGFQKPGVALDLPGLPGIAASAPRAGAAGAPGVPVSELLVYLVSSAAVLAVILAALKGAGIIAWPWAWALAPLLAPFAGVLLVSLVFAAAAFRQIAAKRARARAPQARQPR